MIRHPFMTFFSAVTLLVAGALFFIQSRTFAGIFKQAISKHLPSDLGVDADFSEFAIKIFPPGLSLKNPRITLRARNILKMPAGSSVKADRIDFIFRPFQMFTGDVRVNELVITGGDLRLFVEPKTESKGLQASLTRNLLSLNFHWDELFQIHAEAIEIRDSHARVEWEGTGDSVELQVKSLLLGQWLGRGGLGYELSADLTQLSGTMLDQLPELKSLESLQATAHVNALGARIDAIRLKGKGFEAQGNGMVRGNLQAPKSGLNLDADLSASADIGLIAQAIQSAKLRSEIPGSLSGSASFTGRVRGNLVKPFETLRLQGDFSAKDLRVRKFVADDVEASGTWTSSPTGGEINLEKAMISAHEHPRAPGELAAGGVIRVGALQMRIGSPDPIGVDVELERADVQWLAALALADPKLEKIFPLDFKASGKVHATLFPPAGKRPLGLRAELNLGIDDFLLDNRKFGVRRKEKRIFKVARLELEGPLNLDGDGLHADGLVLRMAHTQLAVAGGVSAKSGFDLRATGQADFSDLGELAENEIHGQGQVTVHVHGPSEKLLVDIDLDVQKAYYLRMDLGEVKGRLTWDDDPNHLLFRDLQAEQGSTQYTVGGMLDAGDANSIALNIDIPKGTMQEFLPIFLDFTREISWFPASVSGPFSGHIQVSGGLALQELEIAGRISGTAWDYLGERFDKVSFQAGFDRGKYYLAGLRAAKRSGRIQGRISFVDPELGWAGRHEDAGELDWDFHTRQMTVNDLDHIAQLDVPIRGKITIDSSGKGKAGSIQSQSRAELTDFSVRGSPMPPSEVSLASAGGVYRSKGAIFGNEGVFDVAYDFNPTRPSELKADFRHLDFTPVLLLLNPKSIDDPLLSGSFSGDVELRFRSGEIEKADGKISLTDYTLAESGTRFQLDQPVSFRIEGGTFDLDGLSIVDYAANDTRRSEAKLRLESRGGALEGALTGDVDVSLAEFFTPVVSRASGAASLDYQIGGTLKAPVLAGQAELEGVSAWVQGLDSPFENITGSLEVKQNAIYVQNVVGDLAGGRASANGTILFFSDRFPLVSLKGDLTGNKLKFYPFQYAKVEGTLSVSGDRIPYLVEGKLNVQSALSKEKMFQQKQTQGFKAAEYTPPPSTRLSDYPKFKLKIDVAADRGIVVQNELFDAEFKSKVTVVNTIQAPRLLGSVDLVQGRMTFKDRVFQIDSANATFDNPTVINPKFTVNAKTDVNGTKVQLYAAGTLDNYKVDLSSEPVMTETDILTLLATGLSTTDMKRMSASNQSTIESGEAASMLLNSLDFNQEIQDKTGLQIQLDESMNSQIGTSQIRPTTQSDNAVAPKIVIKKQVSQDFDVSYGSTVGTGTTNEREVNAEMKVTPAMSVIGVWDNYESTDTTEEQSTTPYSYGLDLKLQKRFK